jgi:hypothetical protein
MAYTTIDDPSAHFQTATWSGNGSTQSITFDGNSDMQPDWVWSKPRGIAFNHTVQDSSRGVGASGPSLSPNLTNVEYVPGDYVMSLDSDGFSVGAGDAGFNASNDTYVSWCWKANGGTTSSNTDGSITSTVQANTDAGFSIVTFTGTGSTATVGHGLGVAPVTIIAKNRDSSANWSVKHHKTPNNYDFFSLNTTDTRTANDSIWTQTDPTSSVFSIGTASAINQSGQDIVAYCFAEKQGYSKFGKYFGNGSTNGPFAYTGFKPAFILIKTDSGFKNWYMWDSTRSSFNPVDESISITSSAELTGYDPIDILSNGFKVRDADGTWNSSGIATYYWAFAESPFVTSTGIPTTAR